jgi:hypothetical protein
MIEPPRKHGPFDLRYPVRPKLPPPVWHLHPGEEAEEKMDWTSFLARFFPGRRRHDFEALALYAAYRKAIERSPADERSATLQPGLLRHWADSPSAIERTEFEHGGLARVGARAQVVASSEAELAWESEGGSVSRPAQS